MTRDEFLATQSTLWLGELFEAMIVIRRGELAISYLKDKGANTVLRLGKLYDDLRADLTEQITTELKNASLKKQPEVQRGAAAAPSGPAGAAPAGNSAGGGRSPGGRT